MFFISCIDSALYHKVALLDPIAPGGKQQKTLPGGCEIDNIFSNRKCQD